MITTAGIAVPEDMATALAADPAAVSTFEAMRPEDQREFVNWLARPGAQNRATKLADLAQRVQRHQHRPPPAE